MTVLLLSNDSQNATRVKNFAWSLEQEGYDVAVPYFNTRNWFSIRRQSEKIIEKVRPDVVHLFNVPDFIYSNIPRMKERGLFLKLVYDYRSPWGIETGMLFGDGVLSSVTRNVCERYEKFIAGAADMITSPNQPMVDKALQYHDVPGEIVPNYPIEKYWAPEGTEVPCEGYVLYIGRLSNAEGVKNIPILAETFKEQVFVVVGDGPLKRLVANSGANSNIRYIGWQDSYSIMRFIAMAGVCLVPRDSNDLTPFATDRSIWKLTEYLNLGKTVAASGITPEGYRKNLHCSGDIVTATGEALTAKNEPISEADKRYWSLDLKVLDRIYQL
jgi:glycosyltransferase involved in cell wall biosynthesis